MATKKQIERKKKAKERKSKARVEARRHKLDAVRREQRRSATLERRFKDKIKPIVNDPEKKRIAEEKEKSKVMERLRRNAEILKALEREYEQDKANKKAINDSLESEGHHTLQEKVRALEEKARAIAGDKGLVDMVPSSELS